MAYISSIYLISWTFPVYYFLPKYFSDPLLAFPFLLEESININSGIIRMTHSPKRVSQTLIPLDIHTLIWITIIKCLAFFQIPFFSNLSVVNILPISFIHPIMTTFMIKLLQLIRTNCEYNISSQNLLGDQDAQRLQPSQILIQYENMYLTKLYSITLQSIIVSDITISFTHDSF